MEVNEDDRANRMVAWYDTYYADDDLDSGTAMGRRREDVFALPYAFVQIAMYEKLWNYLNESLNTLFDEYEYEDVPQNILPQMIKTIQQFIDEKKYRSRNQNEIIKHCYRTQLDGTPLYYAQSTLGEYLDLLDQLCNFLQEAYDKKKDIVVAL